MSSAWDGLLNTPEITELPHYAFGKKAAEDAYYTRREVAGQCMRQFLGVCRRRRIDLAGFTFVEPSAGEGCFFDLFPEGAHKIGVDIAPKQDKFVEADFLRWYPANPAGNFAVVGNPPFGHRGALALAFLNRSLLFAELVAFILPMSFYSNGKGANMKRVQGASLIHSAPLRKNAFYDSDTGRDVEVNTVFQVWRRGEHKSVFCDFDVSEYADIHTCCSVPSRFCGLGRGRDYDCFIASTFYGDKIGVVDSFDKVKYGSGYGIVIKKDKARVLKALKAADWARHSSAATNSCRHIRMFHIKEALGKAGFGKEMAAKEEKA